MDTHDWRAQLLPQTRQIKVDEITDELKFYQSHGGGGELLEVQKIARCYEQKTYAGAASQEDYLQKISSMMLSISKKYWRYLLQPDSRRRIINKILETLKRHIPYSGQEGLDELRQIAARFEEKIYYSATSQRDYLRKISLKMLTMETRGHNTTGNPMPSNFDGPSDTGRRSIRKRKQPQWLADFVTYRVEGSTATCYSPKNRQQNNGNIKKSLPFSDEEGLAALHRVALRFEERIYTAATSQADYLGKISLKMPIINGQNPVANSLPSNFGPSETGSASGAQV